MSISIYKLRHINFIISNIKFLSVSSKLYVYGQIYIYIYIYEFIMYSIILELMRLSVLCLIFKSESCIYDI